MNEAFLAIINPVAGGGRCRDRVAAVLERLRNSGLAVETVETSAAGDATRLARQAYARGYRKFIAVGGDGTSYEIVNGLFSDSQAASSDPSAQIPTLAFLPLGTGNSFLRDFSDPKAPDRGLEHALRSLGGSTVACVRCSAVDAQHRESFTTSILPALVLPRMLRRCGIGISRIGSCWLFAGDLRESGALETPSVSGAREWRRERSIRGPACF